MVLRIYTSSTILALFTLFLSSLAADFPAYPLAVRNPYLSAWLPGSQANELPTAQAQFWTGTKNLGWSILARVDGKTFTLFGGPGGISGTTAASQNSISYTSTHTIATLDAGAATFTIDFFSPVSPKNFLRQSLPFSYVTVSVSRKSSATPHVQIFSAIDDSWTGGQGNLHLAFDYSGTTTDSTYMFNLSDPSETYYKENNDMAAWGSVVLATRKGDASKLFYRSGSTSDLYSAFVNNGDLNGQTPTYKAGDSMAFAHDLAKVSKITSITFAVGQYRSHVVNYLGQEQSGYHMSKYNDALEAVDGFLADYEAAYQESQSLDKQIEQTSSAVSSDYADLTRASVRQIFGAMEITVPASNVADTSDPYIFLKEISTDGNVNTVDVIYPTIAALSVLAPDWIALLLDPLIDYMLTGAWTQDYVIHDIGKVYPNAIGNTDPEAIILQNTGSFFIMVYAYQKLTGDTTWIKRYAALFGKCADYLINNGLYPSSQLDTVDSIPATANQTNLAIISAIGLNAYGAVTGNKTYTEAAQNFANEIYTNGLGTDQPGSSATHFTYNYHDASSSGTLFNLFPDQWLGLNTFPKSAVSMQCNWYSKQLTSVGLPYASVQNDIANGMWDMCVAAICPGDLQGKLFADEVAFLGNGKNTAPFPDRFYVSGSQSGEFVGGRARPTLGTTFAVLAMNGFSVDWS